jgi:hypothetical protein
MPDVQDVIKMAAAYVAATQPELDKAAAARAKLANEAVKTAAVLADRGILDKSRQDSFTEKVASDPTYALEFLRKMAGVVGAEPMGRPSDKVVSTNPIDPFMRAYMPEVSARSGGMVE